MPIFFSDVLEVVAEYQGIAWGTTRAEKRRQQDRIAKEKRDAQEVRRAEKRARVNA